MAIGLHRFGHGTYKLTGERFEVRESTGNQWEFIDSLLHVYKDTAISMPAGDALKVSSAPCRNLGTVWDFLWCLLIAR